MTSLVLSGGSTKIPLHVGFMQAIEEKGIKYTSIYANSAGSIIASALACGYDFDRLYKLILRTDFNEFLKESYLNNLLSQNSLCTGSKLLKFFQDIFGSTTFRDTKLDIFLMAHCLNTRSIFIMSKKTTPDLPLALATRISVSIPLLFTPVLYNEKYYVDGGLSKDFPVDICHDKYIGHLIQSTPKPDWEATSILSYAGAILGQMTQANVEESIRQAHQNGIVIRTNYDLPFTQFRVSLPQKVEMLELGYENGKKNIPCW